MIESVYDFLHYLIFGSDLPYLQKAVDPITIALMAGKGLVGAFSKSRQGKLAADAAKAQQEAQLLRSKQAMAEAQGLVGAGMRGRQEYGLGPSYSDLRKLVLQDPTSDYLRQQAQRQEAGQMQALQAGGARAILGGTQAVAQSTADRLAQIADEEQRRRAAGLQAVGVAEQRVAEQRLADARSDLELGRGLKAEALSAQYGAEDLARAAELESRTAKTQALGQLGETAIDIAGEFFEKGGLVRGKTPGEFSHEENPIDIMQDGQKIGEMTGGEGVVSPEDLGKLEQLAGQGKTPLHKFVRGLIKKLEQNGER